MAAVAAGDAGAVSDSMCIHLFQLQPQSVRYRYVPCGNGEMVGARMHSINFNTPGKMSVSRGFCKGCEFYLFHVSKNLHPLQKTRKTDILPGVPGGSGTRASTPRLEQFHAGKLAPSVGRLALRRLANISGTRLKQLTSQPT